MRQRILRTLILLAASCLVISGARLSAQTTNTPQNQKQNNVQNPMQLALNEAAQNTSPNATPNTSPNTTPNATPNANQQPKPNQPAAAPPGTVPPMIQAGITAMLNAKANLEKAGDKWGGHRVKAIAQIDKALQACGQTPTKGKGEMASGPTDEMALMQTAITQLTTAQNDFKNAKNPWGGRRDQALPFITQALQDLQLAINFANAPKKGQ